MQQQPLRKDIEVYEYILEKQGAQFVQIKPITATTALLTHILFKGIVMALFYFDEIINQLIGKLVTAQICIIFVIVDFWFTKNVNGRRLLGLRWFFSQDQYGMERFKFQTWINPEYVSPINAKIFWIMQIAYLVVPFVDIGTTIIIAPNAYRIEWHKVFVNLVVCAGSLGNLFLFYQASSAASEKLMELKKHFTHQFLRKLGKNSLVSFL